MHRRLGANLRLSTNAYRHRMLLLIASRHQSLCHDWQLQTESTSPHAKAQDRQPVDTSLLLQSSDRRVAVAGTQRLHVLAATPRNVHPGTLMALSAEVRLLLGLRPATLILTCHH